MSNPFNRGIKGKLLDKFKNNGIFVSIIEAIKKHNSRYDKKLSLNIRNNYVNIYYNGGCLAKISSYAAFWNANYYENHLNKDEHQSSFTSLKGTYCKKTSKKGFSTVKYDLLSGQDVKLFLNDWLLLMKIMNDFQKSKERAFQQNVEFANNSKSDNFIIIDTEYAISTEITSKNQGFAKLKPQLDMIALEKIENNKYQLVFIENKIGYQSSSGCSGISEHLQDIFALISNETLLKYFKENIELIANQLIEIDLIPTRKENIVIDMSKHKVKTLFMMSNFWTKEGAPTSSILNFKNKGTNQYIDFSEYGKIMNIEFQFLGNFKKGIGIDNKYIYETPSNSKYTFTYETICDIYKN